MSTSAETPGYFSLHGRCGRLRFVCIYFPCMFGLRLLTVALLSPYVTVEIPEYYLLSFLLSVVLLGPLVIRRLHDVGFSAAFYAAGASGRLVSLALPLLNTVILLPDYPLLLISTICTVWGWLCTLVYLSICLLPSQKGSNVYGPCPGS